MMNSEKISLQGTIPAECAGMRLDQALAILFADYSRARLQQWLRDGQVLINQAILRPRDKVAGGEEVVIQALLVVQQDDKAEPIPLDIVYEDEAIIVLNKPAGLVVHPAAGNREGTMLNALLHHAPELDKVPRAGIVHRLDKQTSGLLVVARTLAAQKSLVEQLQAREFLREYQAVVNGVMTAGGEVDVPIGRHPVQRKRMAVTPGGKPAVTHYRVEKRFRAHTQVSLRLETGRTHQIRVHMAHIRFPILGDPVYGGRLRLPPQSSEALIEMLRGFKRQALHAARLGLQHPLRDEFMSWEAPLPEDMCGLLAALEEDMKIHQAEAIRLGK